MEDTVTVKLSQGVLRGRKVVSLSGTGYYSFQGVPYAKPPVGPLRFKAPERADPWEGVRDALTTGSVCTQYNIFQKRMEGDEDCLFLNVYSPQLPPTKAPRAVMVWIHGGGYIWGSGNTDLYGPDYLVDAGVVLVTINYRLGVLGFYHSDESDVSANNGLRDQTMALRWVQDNIGQFGGDPDNVTIFGESAGGGSVHLLLLSPLTKGLFHKAIPMSGSAFCPWAVTEGTDLKERILRLGQGLGFKDVNGGQSLADFLRTIPVNELVASKLKALQGKDLSPNPIPFLPTIDDSSLNAFLPDTPAQLIKSEHFHNVPIMTGTTSAEGLVIYLIGQFDARILSKINEDIELLLPAHSTLKRGSKKSLEVAAKIKEFYFKERNISEATLKEYIDFKSDCMFCYGAHEMVKAHLQQNHGPLFYYHFSHKGVWGFFESGGRSIPRTGAAHGDELFYLFRSDNMKNDIKPGTPEEKVSSNMVKLWTNFAKTGNPSVGLETAWPPHTSNDPCFLNIDTEITVGSELNKERIEFWEKLYSEMEN